MPDKHTANPANTEKLPEGGAATAGELPEPTTQSTPVWSIAGLVVVLALAALVRYLEQTLPDVTEGSALGDVVAAIEYPVYAIVIGLLGNVVLTQLGLRDRLAGGFRTEFFIKTGLVLLGASINLATIVRAAGPAILQSIVLITVVFGFTWWLGGRLGINDKLRALLATAVSICGVSAAIAAAGAVQAKKEQLAYTASMVIVFALPSIFILPALANVFGLSQPVAGAWIGGNIDTTAAVTAAGAIAGEEALQIAAIVKSTQNALLGIVAVALTAYFALVIERRAATAAGAVPGSWGRELWKRFPKFVLGFIAASVIATVYLTNGGSRDTIAVVNDLRTLFLILAFVSIGLEFRVAPLREAGWRPVGVFASATVVNLLVGFGLAVLLFSGFQVS